ncbi:MAG: HNH endonuclease [Phycisphaerales bacterium]
MSVALTTEEVARLRAAFQMPSVQTMVSRKSSVTNAFVNSLIPVVEPMVREIADALGILDMMPEDVRCVYCGDKSSEWDHLRPLVLNRRPTGYISEIANLVPSCGKCNQSKGNKNWLDWMTSRAPQSPASRGIPDIEKRIKRLQAYESWKQVKPIAFEEIVGADEYAAYWKKLDEITEGMRQCQATADVLKRRIAEAYNVV